MTRAFVVSALLAGLVLQADPVSAQSYAELRGRIADDQGGVMPGVARDAVELHGP